MSAILKVIATHNHPRPYSGTQLNPAIKRHSATLQPTMCGLPWQK